jgi:hypothetical protein
VGKGGLRSFNVSFRVDPHPSKVEGLARFRLQVVSVDSGPIGIVRSAVAWKSKSDQKTVSFTKLKPDDWEEGWHFVRVQALTSDDEPIPLVDRDAKPLPWSDESRAGQQPAPNESELFYVLPEGEFDDVEPVQRAIPRYPSLIHAQRDLQFTAVLDDRDASQVQPTRVAWSERSTERTRASQELIEAKFGSLGAVHIPVSHALRMLEQRILESPGQLCTWRLLIHRGVPGAPKAEVIDWPDSLSVADLIEARKQLFAAVRPESDAHDQPVWRPGAGQELHVGDGGRDGGDAHSPHKPIAQPARDRDLPLQSNAGLPARVHFDGRAE